VVDWYRKTTNIVEIDGSQEIRDVEASLNEALR
jgi:adenylate kinase family enzyme